MELEIDGIRLQDNLATDRKVLEVQAESRSFWAYPCCASKHTILSYPDVHTRASLN